MSCCNQKTTGQQTMVGSFREYISLHDQLKVGEYVDDHRLTLLQSGLADDPHGGRVHLPNQPCGYV